MRHDEGGYVTVEHAISFAGVLFVLALVLSVIQAAQVQASLCHAVQEGARSITLGNNNPTSISYEIYREGVYTVSTTKDVVTVAGSAHYAGPAQWIGAQAHCQASVLNEERS